MAALKEMPFARYYGSVDSTPLFVVLAGGYYERTGDRRLIEAIWPNIEAALLWIERYGDCDGDGFVEYARRSSHGLLHQGWKDSDDAIFHADGTLARGPVALCEVQGYAYAAWKAGAALAAALSRPELAATYASRAGQLQGRFEDVYGATSCPPTRWPWMATNNPAGCAARTPASASSPESPAPAVP